MLTIDKTSDEDQTTLIMKAYHAQAGNLRPLY